MMTTPSSTVPLDPSHVVPVSRDLAYEIAAVSAAILDAREEKTRIAKEKNLEIKALEKRQRHLIEEIRASGDTQLVMNFGSTVSTERALAQSAPTDGDDDLSDAGETDEEVTDRDVAVDELTDRVDDLEAAMEATH